MISGSTAVNRFDSQACCSTACSRSVGRGWIWGTTLWGIGTGSHPVAANPGTERRRRRRRRKARVFMGGDLTAAKTYVALGRWLAP
jgi:hypothetical protein